MATSSPKLAELAVALLWIPGGFCLTCAAIMFFIGSRLGAGGRVAARAGTASCGDVHRDGTAVHVSGRSAAGPQGLLTGPVSGTPCVWHRERLYRIYTGVHWQDSGDGWSPQSVRAEQRVWDQDSGPFALQDDSGCVLLAPTVLDRSLALLYPREIAADETSEQGPEPWRYRYGAIGRVLGHPMFPASLLSRFADAEFQTIGYRVTEEVVRPGVPFCVFGIAAEDRGQPVLAPFGHLPAVSVNGLAEGLTQGGRRSRRVSVAFGLAGLAFFAVSAVVMVMSGASLIR